VNGAHHLQKGRSVVTSDTFVIVGAGLAGAKAAEALRSQGFDGRVVLLGVEHHAPYERPPLSKDYLTGKTAREKVFAHPHHWYEDHDVELMSGQLVTGLDRDAHGVGLADGSVVTYDRLLLTTGASPREPGVPGAHARGVHYLRTLDDSDALRETLAAVSRLVVIGAGWIGLEVTAAARLAGVEVTVVGSAELPLLRVLGPEVAQVFADLHQERGVDFRFNASLAEIVSDDGVATGVRLNDGATIAADAVLVAVGAAPNVQLAEAAGLQVDNGILVDAALRTSDPNIFAAGDVANAFHPFFDRRIRVEHWANARHQPKAAAASMLGNDVSYDELPYFYTDQYDLGMEYVGFVGPDGYDRVVFRGDVAGREFVAFWLLNDRVVAGMNVNVWDVVEPIKTIIRSRVAIPAHQLADVGNALTDLAADG
jgi:3-phenylpropionate/trans-cinnamate dioxygenase ferredoxin reductase component